MEARENSVMVKQSVWDDCQCEMERYKWIESEKAGYDLGEPAIRRWIKEHWNGYLRARWLEHLQGTTYWVELDHDDFELLRTHFQDKLLLLDRIVDRLKVGQENLHIIQWALDWNLPMCDVQAILLALDINGRRMSHRFDA
jgi:hypothetical protein